MKRTLFSILTIVVFLILMCSGALANIVKFFAWLFTLKYTQPETSIVGGIIVRLLTFAVSFGSVYFVFNLFGFFNSRIMSFAYFVISSLAGFCLAYIVWTIEQHIIVIGIVFGVVLFLAVVGIILINVFRKKENPNEDQD